jgi:hypothetical protein
MSDEYDPLCWCVLCGWSTDDPDRDTWACDCDDGTPMSMGGNR